MPECILLQFNWLIGDLSSGAIEAARVNSYFKEEIISAISFSKKNSGQGRKLVLTDRRKMIDSFFTMAPLCVRGQQNTEQRQQKKARQACCCVSEYCK